MRAESASLPACSNVKRAHTVSSDACFMGMPRRVGPVAILGPWTAMLRAAIVGALMARDSKV
jgi:hypothetical protein